MNHVTRIAPSPTGMFHLGSARTALFNWLAAKSSSGQFILRIDDTDVSRNTSQAVDVIYEAMEWLGLGFDLTFRQSGRLDWYREVAAELVKTGNAYEEDGAIKLDRSAFEGVAGSETNPRHGFHAWEDTLSGKVAITDKDREVIDGLVLLRSDGMPTYHYASVFDDMACGVTWVIRGTDHISNTAKHLAIWNALSQVSWSGRLAPKPLWTHVGLLTVGRKKLSKRDRAASVLSYRDKGIDSDAMINWLLRLGWGPSVDDKTTATISRERAIELFLDGGKMRPSPANLDDNLLASLDRKYKAKKEKLA